MHYRPWLRAATFALLVWTPAYAWEPVVKAQERLAPQAAMAQDDSPLDDDAIADRLSTSPTRALRAAPDVRLPASPRGHEAEILKSVMARPSFLMDIRFKAASDVMAPEARDRLAKLAAALADRRLANKRILIGAQTELLGSDAYNAEVATLRARAVADALAKRFGVNAERLETVGFGRIKASEAGSTIRLVNLGAFDGKADAKAPPVAQRGGARTPASLARAPAARFVAQRASEFPAETAPAKRAARRPGAAAWSRDAADPIYGQTTGATDYAAPGYWRVGASGGGAAGAGGAGAGGAGAAGAGAGGAGAGGAGAGGAGAGGAGAGGAGAGGAGAGGAGAGGAGAGGAGAGGAGAGGAGAGGAGAGGAGAGGAGAGGAGAGGAGAGGAGAGGAGAGGAGAGGAGAGGAGAGGAGSGGGGGSWSDRRLKRHIARLGETASGLPLYRFEYIWGGPVYVGVMAQDLVTLRPDALIKDPSGYYQVDYGKLGLRLMTLEAYQRALRGKAA